MVKRATKPEYADAMNAAAAAHPSHRPFPAREPWKGVTAFGLQVLADIRAKLRSPRRPSRDWAHKIIAKHAAGHHVVPYALECAREVAGHGAEREPGSDDE